jgi:cyclopropane-fatty-acyl-phospholipid synthase
LDEWQEVERMRADTLPSRTAVWVLRKMLAAMGSPSIRVKLWTGDVVGGPEGAPAVTIRDPGAFARLVLDPELAFGDLWVEERLDVEGDLPAFLEIVFRARAAAAGLTRWLPRRLLERALRTDLGTATRNAQHHYDLGNAFYELWLDERMVYTCAYFPTPEATLEEAQLAKLDHVARKLALRPGERVVEAGCGWGALALHMARYYGVTVRAFNVSHEQILYAREQAEKQGLEGRVEFVEDDYRHITGRYDAFVSVGMLEHVGVDHYETLGHVIARSLEPEGRGLIHSIGRSRPQRLQRWIRARVFPNAHPPTLSEMMRIFEPQGFGVLDVEDLRLHYRLTAEHWLRRYERELPPIEALVGRARARTWHLYLAGAVASFASATLHLYQLVFTRAANDAIPWSRAHLYTGEAARFGREGGIRHGAG